ncbi:MAG: methylenetetrahydrofolate reductase [Syntrophobacterales bacterium]|nr:methylenetetrahydrofolate reductase [Syntrophobacterales bacterium]
MSKLKDALAAGGFPLVVEVKPPKGVEVAGMLAPVTGLNGQVTAFGVPDNEHARMRLSALAAARLVQEAGGEPLMLLTCRDRNRLALESDLLGAAALGVENLLLLSGDYVHQGDHPDAKPVYDADSVQLLQLARELMAGRDSAGNPLKGAPTFFLGAVVIPEAQPLGPQRLKFRKKMEAGADFFVTAPIFDLDRYRAFRREVVPDGVKILACLKVSSAEEVEKAARGELRKVYTLPPAVIQELSGGDPEEVLAKGAALAGRLARQLRSEKLADGVYLKAKGRADLAAAFLQAAGF